MNQTLLYKLFKGYASEKEKQKIKEWVASSEQNSQQFFQQRKMFDLLTLLPEERQSVMIRKKTWLKEFRNIAAAVVFTLLCSAVGFRVYRNRSDRAAGMLVQTIEVPVGQHISISLPDGTKAWLNSGTTLSWSSADFGKKGARRVSLEGEGFFDVAHDESRPFVVETYYMDVKAIGTQFNVYANEADNTFETSLLRGKVVIDDKSEKQVMALEPKQKVILASDGRLNKSIIGDYDTYRWREGLYCFKSKSLSEIFHDLERYYDTRIQFPEGKFDNQRITGKFRIKDGIGDIMSILRREIGFSYDYDDENVIIVR